MSIQVKNIEKHFGQYHALQNISLDFPEGKLIALLGPSGCGKTTLLRIIAGLETADSGQIILNGQDATHLHVQQRNIGFMFQHYALFKHMTVFDNVAFGLRVKKQNRPSETDIKKRVMELLELVQLPHLAQRYPAQLSGGQRQRIALARALAVEPKVLLLDEPFGALDAKVRKELRRWLRNLHDELHISSIFVTHDQEEALEVADEIVVMNKGIVEQVGSPKDVYQAPATAFVFDFLGNANKFEADYQNAQLTFGEDKININPHNIETGQVIAFVRPEDVQVFTRPEQDSIQTTFIREIWIGGRVLVELIDRQGQHWEISLNHEQATQLALRPEQNVWIKPNQVHVFKQ
ncbi:sulfate/molybdate ABC transporter ATP-binding protein [Moraxella sp. ZY210820]|uniref:sulfate/molybdate ABC transporter ATP-binding protein n=1 Tax=unclassified Moraxella TaxID=2685852 RepID=UPI00272FD98A|nr:sulfate ABC transporter ATP-binding protein [Moraxella sp. ZY210820]WLF84708.1 sulfate ABC transporter ATP-binding protein [Moraxella sp. ZY210820]